MNGERPLNDTGLMEEELVAYLDGELPDADRARIERRLADDAAYQRKLAQLQKAWDLLDLLQKAEPDAEFARSTVEMVAIQQEKDAELLQTKVERKKVGWLVGGGLAIVLLAAAGYFVVWNQWLEPERQFLKDVPVIQRVEQLRHADSVEFLEQLHKEGLFAGEGEDAI
jgi:anti-sigma factor RsiW